MQQQLRLLLQRVPATGVTQVWIMEFWSTGLWPWSQLIAIGHDCQDVNGVSRADGASPTWDFLPPHVTVNLSGTKENMGFPRDRRVHGPIDVGKGKSLEARDEAICRGKQGAAGDHCALGRYEGIN